MQRTRLALVAIIAAVLAPSSAWGDPTDVQVDQRVRDAVSTVRVQVPEAPLKATQVAISFTGPTGNLLRSAESRYQWLGNGLWGVLSTIRQSNGTEAQQRVTLCGMLDVLATTSGNASTSQTFVVPIGKAFVPFGMTTTFVADSASRISEIAVDAQAMCYPAPGSSFEFKTRTEMQVNARAVHRSLSVVSNGRCQTSQPKPARELHPELRGDYLPVACEISTDDGKTVTRRFAYLVSSAYYVLLETKLDTGPVRYEVQTIEYAE